MSKSITASLLVLLGILPLIIAGCVELTDQRISWFHDESRDELRILIYYDGIHDSGDTEYGRGVDQVRDFVRDGDVMFRDWTGHIEMAELRGQLQDENAEPPDRDSARLITTLKTEPVGYYREPDGRIGAAQLVTIPNVKAFVSEVNSLISRQLLAEDVNESSLTARTQKRMRIAAKDGHQWFSIEGHAIRFTLPVHPHEWLRAKGKFFDFLLEEAIKAREAAGKDETVDIKVLMQAVSSVPVSYIESDDRVTFVLGRPKIPCTWRLKIENEYEPSLEKVVVETVEADLDRALANVLLGEGAKPSAQLSDILNFGPPEEKIRALMAAARNGDDSRKKAALEKLESLAGQWNRDQGVPKAPQKMDELEDYLAAWKKWYGQMRQFPIYKENE